MPHTPRPSESKDVSQHEPCGCVGLGYAVNFCPLHEAARELLEACKSLISTGGVRGAGLTNAIDRARAAIAKAEGTPNAG